MTVQVRTKIISKPTNFQGGNSFNMSYQSTLRSILALTCIGASATEAYRHLRYCPADVFVDYNSLHHNYPAGSWYGSF